MLAAHGSTDPRFADVVDVVAAQVRSERPSLDVRIGYLDHGPPSITEVVDDGCVVVPLLLSGGYHLRVDIPAQTSGAVITAAVGPDPLLATALADRLHEAGYDGRGAIVLAGAGSSDEGALDDVRTMARHLGDRLGVEVTTAFVSAGSPRLSELRPGAVASYLLAPGTFYEAVAAAGADVVSAPIGAHPAVAEVVLTRYDLVRTW